jgi:hypothetical protein
LTPLQVQHQVNAGTSAMHSSHEQASAKFRKSEDPTRSSYTSDKLEVNYAALQPKPMNAKYPDNYIDHSIGSSTYYKKNYQGRVT